MAKANKAEERRILERFLQVTRISGEIIDDVNESPDFLVRLASQEVVGIEVTELFTGQSGASGPLQAHESIADEIVARAWKVYRNAGGPYAEVRVLFALGQDLRKVQRDEAAAELAAFILSHHVELGQYISWTQDYRGRVPHVIQSIGVCGLSSEGLWSTPSSGWQAPLTAEILQARVNEKAARLPTYAERVPTNWLLMASDRGRGSQLFAAPTEEVVAAVVSPFARTYYYGCWEGLVVQLGIKA